MLLELAIAYILVFTLGAAIGSFLNVVVYRLPAGLSLLFPPSRCPHCLRQLGKRDNVPVLGWLWLRGKCRFCHSPIAARYPIVEAVTGLLFLWVFIVFGFKLETLGYWAFLSWLLALSLIDLDTMTLPNPLTQSGLILGLGFQIWIGWSTSGQIGAINHLFGGIAGAVLGIWLFDIIGIVGSIALGQPAMGGGDGKLAAMMGAWLGWKYLLLAGFLACTLGAIVGGGAIALGIISRRQPIPFGPYLALGAALTVFWGETLLSTYLSVFFPTL
ncbi:prepilin peptidase [Merismopedia glauca]|uniref:Prepilin leader peptidase/N-methyltransferase n=1 Tax=Merismopedia glauca CCAP 1448/3 TaxID=1296344 RepID=A0A2T1C9N6_9CYAN|nr:A24 family peptidase [Merismopedia glauca]PSB04867.1 prepilin peptidase [Merismopedia glauca CCAP 1448/3]